MSTNPFEKFRTKIAEGLFALNTKLFADGEKVSGDNPLPMKLYGSNNSEEAHKQDIGDRSSKLLEVPKFATGVYVFYQCTDIGSANNVQFLTEIRCGDFPVHRFGELESEKFTSSCRVTHLVYPAAQKNSIKEIEDEFLISGVPLPNEINLRINIEGDASQTETQSFVYWME